MFIHRIKGSRPSQWRMRGDLAASANVLVASSLLQAAVHNLPLRLTLSGVPELTCTQQVVFSQSLLLKGGFHTRSDVSSHSCSPLIHSQCISALRLSASLPRMSAPLHLQDPSLAPRISVPPNSVGSIWKWAGNINRRRTPSSPSVSRAD